MEKIKKYIFMILGVLFLIIMALNIYYNTAPKINPDNYVEMDYGWSVTYRNAIYENVRIGTFKMPSVGKGDVIEMSIMLPEEQIARPVLVAYTIHSDIEVFVDDVSVYRYGQGFYEADRMVGYGYHLVPLEEEYMGKHLRILMRVNEDDAFTSLSVPKIYDEHYWHIDFIASNRLSLAVNLFLIIFGVGLTLVSAIFIVKVKEMYRLMCIALFSFCIGTWSLCSYDTIALFSYNVRLKAYLEFESLYLAPIFIMIYFAKDVMRRNKRWAKYTFYTLLAVQVVFALTVFITQACNVLHYPYWVKISHTLILIMALFLLVIICLNVKDRMIDEPIVVFGIFAMLFFILYDLIHFNLQKYSNLLSDAHFSNSLYIGTLIFVLSLMVDFCLEVGKSVYSEAESDALAKLAYTDSLTGIANRRRCEEFFDQLDRQESKYAVIEFDLNNLKKVNDSLGHDAGDEYIRTFGRIVKEVFAEYGIAGRIGGDEFVAVIEDASSVDVDLLIENMQERISELNKLHVDWNMSTAYGICYAWEAGVRSIRSALKIADERMYHKKNEMKGICGNER